MTHTIKHQYDELLPAAWPGLEIHIVYNCESEIVVDEDGEHDPRLISISARVDVGHLSLTLPEPPLPREEHGSGARKFLAALRENARQALWAKALRVAKASAAFDRDPLSINEIANRWLRTGSTKKPKVSFPLDKPKKPFVE